MVTTPTVEPANAADVTAIRRWLKAEYERAEEGFYNHLEKIKQARHEGNLFVVRDKGRAVGFVAASPERYDFLEIHPRYRKMRFGRALAEFCIERSRKADVFIIEIECNPYSSLTFWKQFGFEASPGSPYARRIFPKTFDLPADAKPVDVLIEFLPEEKGWKPDVLPRSQNHPKAAWVGSKYVQLESRLKVPSNGNMFIRVMLNGKQVFCEKLNDQKTRQLGVQHGVHASHIDGINVPD